MISVTSNTTRVLVGCGNIYITKEYNEGKLHKIYMQRTNKLHCSPSVLVPLFKSCTYTTRRDMKQAIKDYKGTEVDACEKYNIKIKNAIKQGELAAYSCSDAIARVLEMEMRPLGDTGHPHD